MWMVNRKVVAVQIKFVFIYKQFFLGKEIKNSKYKIITFSRKGTSPELSCCTARSSFHLYFKKTENDHLHFGAHGPSFQRITCPVYLHSSWLKAAVLPSMFYFMAWPLVRSYSAPPLLPASIYMLVLLFLFLEVTSSHAGVASLHYTVHLARYKHILCFGL